MDRQAALIAGGLLLVGGGVVLVARLARPRPSTSWPYWVAPITGGQAQNGWGDPRPGRGGVHEGVDIYVPEGTPVRAVDAGQVILAREGYDGFAGLYVVVDHQDGFLSRYLHLSRFAVAKGDWVSQGEVIGFSGRTGISNDDPHLHFDVRASGAAFDEYRQLFGTPEPGFATHDDGYAVPAEAITPVSFSSDVIAKAGDRGVRVLGVTA